MSLVAKLIHYDVLAYQTNTSHVTLFPLKLDNFLETGLPIIWLGNNMVHCSALIFLTYFKFLGIC